MNLLANLLRTDPSTPRLTVYNEKTGARLDFSAITLDNWAAKIANFLYEELDLSAGDTIALRLPHTWQHITIVLGALAAGIKVELLGPSNTETTAEVWFVSPEHATVPAGVEVVVVTDDAFGRGVVECGGEISPEHIDFGSTVRMFGDQFYQPGPTLGEAIGLPQAESNAAAERVLSCGWHSLQELYAQVLAPIAAGGSAVVVNAEGLENLDEARLAHISSTEKVTRRVA